VAHYNIHAPLPVHVPSVLSEPISFVHRFSHTTFHSRSFHTSEQSTFQYRSTTQGRLAPAALARDPFTLDLGAVNLIIGHSHNPLL